MKRNSVLLAMSLLLGLLPGCNAGNEQPQITTSKDDTTTSNTTTPEETTTAPTTPQEPKSFHLEIGEPVVVTQGAVGDNAWGHYQFPGLAYTLDGNIVANWHYSSDTIDYDGIVLKKVSTDGGKNWSDDESLCYTPDKFQMSNGKYFAGFRGAGAHDSTWQNAYDPGFTWAVKDGDYKLFFAEDLPKNDDNTVWGYEYDPATDTTEEFECTVNWPHASITEFPGGKIYPMTQMFALSQDNIVIVDGVMYLAMYFYGFNSYSSNRAAAISDYCKYYSSYIFTSKDNGRTWDFLVQFLPIVTPASSEGLCEPNLNIMPDGSMMILMRSGSNSPSYWSRSANNGKTWSSVKKFDDIGVLPQMVTLGCGVSVATYGRPHMRIRATSDPTGRTWKPAQIFDLSSGENNSSCYYTDLLALDDTHALWIYSDFKYPNADGVPVKSIITRVITVVFDE